MKQVILARPHPMIIGDMQEFLQMCGYQPVEIKSREDLLQANIPNAAGAIISMAAFSTIPDSVEHVFRVLRKLDPDIPVVFSFDFEYEVAKSALEVELRDMVNEMQCISVINTVVQDSWQVRRNVFVLLKKSDLAEHKAIAAQLLSQHFR